MLAYTYIEKGKFALVEKTRSTSTGPTDNEYKQEQYENKPQTFHS